MGESGDHLLRDPRHPPDAAVPLQHWRHHGPELPVPVLASLLLRLHQEAQEGHVPQRAQHQEQHTPPRGRRRRRVTSDFLPGLDGGPAAPVLSNKYAIEREERATLPRRGHSSSTKNGSAPQHHLAVDLPPPPPPLPPSPLAQNRDSLKDSLRSTRGGYTGSYSSSGGRFRAAEPLPRQPSPCRPRIMSPMGFAISRQQSQRQSNRSKPVPIWLCVFLVVTYILCGAVLFMQWERWEFLDSAYFCFITLTTIGFGDFVPAKRVQNMDAEVSIALCSLYLLFGIALLAMSFNLVQEEVINNVKSVAKRLGIVKDDEDEDE
ncbi:hypothetical protein C0J52_20005 [Blattella germanica]|nr:hypothetical protein C0J52_20005 [Blattella germanica]